MVDGEQLIAEKQVPVRDHQMVHVRISQHADEQFWRVAFSPPDTLHHPVHITVGSGESFLMSLIQEAVGGQQAAWDHLALWGHSTLLKPAIALRTAVA